MNVLCVGGAGYLGSHVVRVLTELGEQVTVLDNLTYQDEYRGPAAFVFGDVIDSELIAYQVKRHDAVIWLAAIVGDAACAADPARAIAVNQEAIRAVVGCGKPIVFTSSCSVYGLKGGEANEDAPLKPLSIYAETKLKGERYLPGERAVILRLGTLHGVSDRLRFDLVVNAMTRDAVDQGLVRVYGGHQRRPLLAVQDAADYIALQVLSEVPHPGIYNLAGENLTIEAIGERVVGLTGARLNLIAADSEDRRDYEVSSRRAKEYDFEPMRSIDDSIHDLSSLLRSGRIKNPYSPRYANAARFQ